MVELVSYEVEGKIATIKINRAEKMNALSRGLRPGLTPIISICFSSSTDSDLH